MSDKSWLERKMDEADAYRAKFSAWDDFKFSAGFIVLPLLFLAFAGLLIYGLVLAIF